MAASNLTSERLRELLTYHPDTGLFTRNGKRGRWRDGEIVGCFSRNRFYITVDRKIYVASRLAWLYMTGAWPKHEIDHIDTDSTNDVWHNLRDVTGMVNTQNRRAPRAKNKSGFLGVMPNGKAWAAQIVSNHVQYHLGTFPTPEQAHAVYLEAKRRLHVGCTL